MTIDLYLAQVARRLRGMPKEVADGRLRELRTHLELARSELEAAGSAVGEEAERESIARMGSPRSVADEIVRQHLGYATASSWKLSRWLMPILALAILIPYAIMSLVGMHPREYQDVPIDAVFAVGGWVATAAYCSLVWRTRRWLILPAVATALAATVVMAVAITVYEASASRTATGTDGPHGIARARAELASEQASVDAWRAGRPPIGKGPIEVPSSGTITMPLLPVSIPVSLESSYRMQSMPVVDARTAWAKLGGKYAEDLRHRTDNIEGRVPETGSTTLWNRRGLALVIRLGAYFVALFCVWNTAVLGLARLVEGLARKRMRVAR